MLYKEIDVRESPEPVAEALDRVGVHLTSHSAYQRLYGPDTRSGNVRVVGPEWWGSWEWVLGSSYSVRV